MSTRKALSYEEVYESTIKYFNGDELATDVWISKYCLRDSQGNYYESNPDNMHWRLAQEFARPDVKYEFELDHLPSIDECFNTAKYQAYYTKKGQEYYELFKDFKYIIPQGSPMAGLGNPYQLMSLSNCFALKTHDSYGGILKTDQELTHVFRRRGGCGVNLDPIRPIGMPTANAALTTDGIVPFMERFSNTCREVATKGRRGAEMLTISVHHPQVIDFIEAKLDLKKITGANISVKASDEFMEAVIADENYEQRWPVDADRPKIQKLVRAKDVWDKIIDSAWQAADPGIFFWDTVLKNSPADCYKDQGFRTITSNPCLVGSTEMTLEDPACQGASIQVPISDLNPNQKYKFMNKDFDFVEGKAWKSGFKETIKLHFADTMFWTPKSIECTEDHLFLTYDGEEVKAKDMFGKQLWNRYWNQPIEVVKITDAGKQDVYDFSLEDDTHWGVANGVVVHNCGEVPLPNLGRCLLMLLNIVQFVDKPFTKESSFNWLLFEQLVQKAQHLIDNLVDLELEAIGKIIAKVESDPEPEDVKRIELDLWKGIYETSKNGRRTGLGVTAIGDTLAALGIRYGSEESIEFIDKLYGTQAVNSYKSSVELAKERGAFPVFDWKLEKDNNYLNKIWTKDLKVYEDYCKYGRRNIANLTTAPAGSVSLLAQLLPGLFGTTSGFESVFSLSYKRRKKIVDGYDADKVTFVDQSGDKWKEFIVYHNGLKAWMDINNKTEKDIEESPYWKATAMDLDWINGVRMQAAATHWLDHSLSRTQNLPSDVDKETVSNIYLEAWKSGCKGFTVYRDGSRTGVLVSVDENSKDRKFDYIDAFKRPEYIDCEIHQVNVKGQAWIVLVGLIDGRPYELFGGICDPELMKKFSISGNLRIRKRRRKTTRNKYDLYQGEELILNDILDELDNSDNAVLARFVSLSLRHGAKPNFLSEQLRKDPDASFNSFSKVLARVLKKYIEDGTSVSSDQLEGCQQPGQCNLVYQEGCVSCTTCGLSKCN